MIRESKLNNDDNDYFDSSEIPLNFLTLVDTDIINKAEEINESSITNVNKHLWIEFGQWLGFNKPIKEERCDDALKISEKNYNMPWI